MQVFDLKICAERPDFAFTSNRSLTDFVTIVSRSWSPVFSVFFFWQSTMQQQATGFESDFWAYNTGFQCRLSYQLAFSSIEWKSQIQTRETARRTWLRKWRICMPGNARNVGAQFATTSVDGQAPFDTFVTTNRLTNEIVCSLWSGRRATTNECRTIVFHGIATIIELSNFYIPNFESYFLQCILQNPFQ